MNIEAGILIVAAIGLIAFVIVRRKKKAGVDKAPPRGPGRETPDRTR